MQIKSTQRRISCAAIVALILLASNLVAAKPSSPIEGWLKPSEISAKVGTTIPFTLAFKSKAPAKELKIGITLSDGLLMKKGEPYLTLSDLKANEEKKVTFQIRVLKKGEQSVAVGVNVVQPEKGGGFGKTFISRVNPASTPSVGTETMDSEGTKAIVTNSSSGK